MTPLLCALGLLLAAVALSIPDPAPRPPPRPRRRCLGYTTPDLLIPPPRGES